MIPKEFFLQFLHFIISIFIVDLAAAQRRVSSRSSLSFSLDFEV